MILLQVVGTVTSVLIVVYGIHRYRKRRYRRLDLITSLLIAAGLLILALEPAIGNVPARLLGLRTSTFDALFVTSMLLLWLFSYGLHRASLTDIKVGELVRALARAEYRRSAGARERPRTLFIVIPAYNEEQSIGGVLRQLPQTVQGLYVQPLVVVDGASDDTEGVVRSLGFTVTSHVMNRGQGDALRTGFEIALNEGAEIVMTMDADGQHQAEDIEKLVQPILDGEADYVMGSRFLGEYDDQGGFRHAGIVIFTALLNLFTRAHITDCTNGFRAIRASSLAMLELHEDRFSAPELIIEAVKKGLRIQEVPVRIARRSAGESKKPRRLEYPLGFLRTMVQTWLR